MKQIYFYLIFSLFLVAAHAEKVPRAKTTNILTEGSVHFKFNNFAPAEAHKDSVLIIFDKFNRTGAGVIYKVFSADKDQSIIIEGVQAGKYYVTIQGLGLHRDRFEKIITIKSRKNEKVKINLQDSEEFDRNNVVIPEYQPNSSAMSVVNMK
ncbi:MAG TPA: hypothetical protein VK563_15045 [Puia sp.]|nr:hypothetical protein [Puia sp.]